MPVTAARIQVGIARPVGLVGAHTGMSGFGTVTSPPHCGHNAISPTSAVLADMCCPQCTQLNVKLTGSVFPRALSWGLGHVRGAAEA